MLNQLDQAQVYTDFQGLAKLRVQASQDSGAALDEVTQQFEAYFLQQLMKSARAASFGDGLLQSDQEQMFQGLYDQQLALNIAGDKGLGLAKILQEQIQDKYRLADNEVAVPGESGVVPSARGRGAPAVHSVSDVTRAAPAESKAGVAPATATEVDEPFASPEDFVQRLLPIARAVAGELGVDPRVLVAQAALETGWGKSVIQRGDGSSSHNLFGIKADRRWSGDTVHANTLEYEEGVVVRRRESFRAYDGFADSFNDYLTFLRENPRYGEVLDRTGDPQGFLEGLQQAGYATDLKYAEKILSILGGQALRNASG